MKVWVTDMTKLPIISNIEVAAVICALITIVLIFSLLLELDTFVGAISPEVGRSLLKMKTKSTVLL